MMFSTMFDVHFMCFATTSQVIGWIVSKMTYKCWVGC